MNFWESFGVAFIPAIVTAIIGGIISFWCAKNQNKSEIEKIELEHNKQLADYKQQSIYDVKKEAIFESLDVLDLYLSWLNYDDNSIVPFREQTTPLDITTKARQCFNNLCITCESEALINLFGQIIFDKNSNVLCLYEKFRNEARKELGLSEIEFDKNIIFLSQVSTKDLNKQLI